MELFTAASIMIAKVEAGQMSLTGEWIHKMWATHMTEYHLTLKNEGNHDACCSTHEP
jgi:hypothetical protein